MANYHAVTVPAGKELMHATILLSVGGRAEVLNLHDPSILLRMEIRGRDDRPVLSILV